MSTIGAKELLLVDDEAGIRATLAIILRRRGFRVAVAATVAEALQEIDKQRFDLLLADLNIERDGDGFQVVEAMRYANPLCVNIVLTGYPGLESAIEGIHHGIDDYILKPTDADKLVRQMLLETQGYGVISAMGLDEGLARCEDGEFDVFILGHSIPHHEKKKLVEAFHRTCPGPIISLRRNTG